MKLNKIKKLIEKIFISRGFSREHAKITSKALINAELVGAYGHDL